ncbi:MAG: MmcB family DNA repair protein [Pseudomonadota bacterium]
MSPDASPPLSSGLVSAKPGQLLARGVCRHLHSHDFACLEEFTPERGKRVDVLALGARGEIWIIECKSSRADFTSDAKWQGYLEWCDRYFWAVDADFPTALLPDETGLILADAYDAQIIHMGDENRLPAARRTALIRRFGRASAFRLQSLRDPAQV